MSDTQRPKPYAQGKLDQFCSLYATINALRLLCAKSGIKAKINWRTLMRLMLMELERRSFLSDIFHEGVTEVQIRRYHRTVQRYLKTKHGIALETKWCWANRKTINLKLELQRLQRIAESQSQVAMILFGTRHYDHWSVADRIDKTHVHLFDSCGHGSRHIRHMHFDQDHELASNRQTVLGPESLVILKLLNASKIDNTDQQA
jgi:hypothetical protein